MNSNRSNQSAEGEEKETGDTEESHSERKLRIGLAAAAFTDSRP